MTDNIDATDFSCDIEPIIYKEKGMLLQREPNDNGYGPYFIKIPEPISAIIFLDTQPARKRKHSWEFILGTDIYLSIVQYDEYSIILEFITYHDIPSNHGIRIQINTRSGRIYNLMIGTVDHQFYTDDTTGNLNVKDLKQGFFHFLK